MEQIGGRLRGVNPYLLNSTQGVVAVRLKSSSPQVERARSQQPDGFEYVHLSDIENKCTRRADCRWVYLHGAPETVLADGIHLLRDRAHDVLAILIYLYSAMTNRMTITSKTVTVSRNREYCCLSW